MEQRNLGNSNVKLSAIGLGCMGMSQSYGPGDEKESIATLNRAVELGITLFDTADVYGNGSNEILIGKALKPFREKIKIATKFGFVNSPDPKRMKVNGKPEYVKEACEASLKRLELETIDLYYAHRVDPDIPIEETVGAMSRLVEEGKVKYIGLSEASANSIRKAFAVHPISALQSEYSLWTRELEMEIIPLCEELGITIIPFSPLGRGFLTGKISSSNDFSTGDFRKNNPRFEEENLQKNLTLLKKLEEIALEKKCTSAQLALAWVLAKAPEIIPIPGTKRRKYLNENIMALEIKLTQTDLDRINDVMPVGIAAGNRYNDAMMNALDK